MPSCALSCVGAVLALALMAAPVAAQTPIDPLDGRDAKRLDRMEKVLRELRSIVFALRDTGKPVVVQPADTDLRLQEISDRLADLEQSLRRINGSLESNARDLAIGKQENAALQAQVKALGERLAALEQQLGPAPPPPPPGDGAPPGASDGGRPSAADSFANARQLMLGGDYDSAQAAFSDFVAAYPDDPKAPEARYWLGKTLAVRGAHAQAATAYIGAIRGWPRTSWAPDATVELARSLTALRKTGEACQILTEYGRRYPKAPAAVNARATKARADAKCG